MLKRLTWLCGVPAVIFATLLLLAGAYFGSSRDFGAFLFSIPVLALLFLGALAATVWATRIKAERSRAVAASVLICLTPLAYLYSYGVVQRIRFLLWAPAHYRQLEQASKKDGIIMGWDSWGMAGQDTFSYLVVDTQDRLGSKARADQWTRQIGQSCGLWQAQRMRPRLYVVTTYTNCPYDGVQPAG
jgi:hypothetical protein